jgi:hypothetical protein
VLSLIRSILALLPFEAHYVYTACNTQLVRKQRCECIGLPGIRQVAMIGLIFVTVKMLRSKGQKFNFLGHGDYQIGHPSAQLTDTRGVTPHDSGIGDYALDKYLCCCDAA